MLKLSWVAFLITYPMERIWLWYNETVFLVSFFFPSSYSLAVWFRLKCNHSASIFNMWMFGCGFFLDICRNMHIIHVILSDGAGPAYSYWERTSALKCLLGPRTQAGESLGVISHSVIIFVQKYYGVFEQKFKLTSEQRRRRKTYWNVSLTLIQ